MRRNVSSFPNRVRVLRAKSVRRSICSAARPREAKTHQRETFCRSAPQSESRLLSPYRTHSKREKEKHITRCITLYLYRPPSRGRGVFTQAFKIARLDSGPWFYRQSSKAFAPHNRPLIRFCDKGDIYVAFKEGVSRCSATLNLTINSYLLNKWNIATASVGARC